MSKEKDKCDTCEHRGDSSNEYCGSCGGGVESNWKEAGWSKDKTINELRTRVAELEKELELRKTEYMFNTPCKELQNRLSQAEEKEKELRENWLEDMQEWSVEKATLLKASEGMEKALEEILATDTMITAVHAADKSYEIAKQALADFRALKERL
jgi:succinate dehydrogenase/fumarate reductase flavoprotein subunit